MPSELLRIGQHRRRPLPNATKTTHHYRRIVRQSGMLGSQKRISGNSVDHLRACMMGERNIQTKSTTPIAFHAHKFVAEPRVLALMAPSPSPPPKPPSPSMVLLATTSTKSHSRSSANPCASLRAASVSRGSNSKAFWKHFDARFGSGVSFSR